MNAFAKLTRFLLQVVFGLRMLLLNANFSKICIKRSLVEISTGMKFARFGYFLPSNYSRQSVELTVDSDDTKGLHCKFSRKLRDDVAKTQNALLQTFGMQSGKSGFFTGGAF